ncbi:MAG: glucose 1-dehydrogenase [Cyanobacteria bacterium P01_E01_bin.42]
MIHFDFDDKVAFVTGGSKGIGKAVAKAFARSGAKVAICARGVEAGEETAHHICDSGGKAIFIQTDVSQDEQVKNAIAKTLDVYGRLDFAVNNAATPVILYRPLIDICLDDWQKMIACNLTSVFSCLKYEILEMLEGGGGSIVNIASPAGIVGEPFFASYCASKAGIIGLTKSAAVEYAPHNIRINCVTPGRIESEIALPDDDPNLQVWLDQILQKHPIGRMGQPDEVAHVVLSICSSTFTLGANWLVDGGATRLG